MRSPLIAWAIVGGAPTPNSVNTPLSSTGTFNIFNNNGKTNVIVDVNGYYAKIDSTSRFEAFEVNGSDFTGNAMADPVQPGNGSFAFTSDIGACARAPIEVPVGVGIDSWSVGISYELGAFSLSLFAYPNDPGTSAIEAATPVEVFSDDVTLTDSSLGVIAGIDADISSLNPLWEVTASYHYELEMCSDTDLVLFGATMRF